MSITIKSDFRFLAIIFCLFAGTPGIAQKIEVENRIRKETFPSDALQYLQDRYPDLRRVKYYREISADTVSFEAKFRLDRHLYSVEFFADGTLMDIEKKIRFRTLPEDARRKIEARWTEDFQKFRVIKCQEQTIGDRIRYEIEVRGKTEEDTEFYQYLFESDGAFVDREVIVQRPTDMTLY